ncbi:MAG: hypothetical protein WBV23_05690 [Desulfobaccales bacterium]
MLIGFVVWFFLTGTPSSPPSHQEAQPPPAQTQPDKGLPVSPPVPAQVPADPSALLKGQLAQVLAGIGAANQKKDLAQLLSYYSPNFPRLSQRAQHISASWKIYDYPKMDFQIKEISLLDDTTALARVNWNVEAQNLRTRQNKTIVKTYLIRFVRESGQWRVKALDKAN